uniref:KRAB domain-containing protein n=1 Tax=Naja naja TaxID=35670 RepID=A0A8C6X1Y5_NAJNA
MYVCVCIYLGERGYLRVYKFDTIWNKTDKLDSLLDTNQKSLHQEVMLEMSRIVAFLGKGSSEGKLTQKLLGR